LEPWFDGSFLAQHGKQSVLPPDERQPKLMLSMFRAIMAAIAIYPTKAAARERNRRV
jgi:hypothetical protein